MKIKQGDAYSIPIRVRLNGELIAPENVAAAEFYIGGYRKLYPSEVTYSASDGYFYIPVTQEESFSWAESSSRAFFVAPKTRSMVVLFFRWSPKALAVEIF